MTLRRPPVPPPAQYETLAARVEVDAVHKRQRAGESEFARVRIVFEPGEPGSGYVFEVLDSAGGLPERFWRGVEAGLDSSRRRGPVAGLPVSDIRAALVDGAWDEQASSELTFLLAAEMAFTDLRQKGVFKVVGERLPEPGPPAQSARIIPFPKRP